MKVTAKEDLIREQHPEAILDSDLSCKQPYFLIDPKVIKEVCLFVRDHPEFSMDFLSCLSGVDLGENEEELMVVYHLYSLVHEEGMVLKCKISKESPTLSSVAEVWKAAEWHEREAYDMVGIHFEGHPDPRRILLPEDWEGHPLRKDYKEAETYHDIKIRY